MRLSGTHFLILEDKTVKKSISIILILTTLFLFVSCSGASPLDPVTLKLNDTARCRDCSIKFSSTIFQLIVFGDFVSLVVTYF